MSDLPVSASLVPPVGAMKTAIGNSLNAAMTCSFLMVSKKGAKQRLVVVSTITLLYITCICSFALNWWCSITFAVVEKGGTRASMYFGAVKYPQSYTIALLALQSILFIVSDGLLIWRCFHVWNQSYKVIAVPLFLVVAEAAIAIGFIILDSHTPDYITEAQAALRNNLQSVEFYISFGTTIITTSLIAYRIYSTARMYGITSLGRFKHIVEVLIQSAALYSLFILAMAVMMVIPTYLATPNGMFNAEFFIDSLLPVVGGLAPTIVVGRLAIATPDDSHTARTTKLTGLHFQTQPPISQSDTERDLGSIGGFPTVREKNSSSEV